MKKQYIFIGLAVLLVNTYLYFHLKTQMSIFIFLVLQNLVVFLFLYKDYFDKKIILFIYLLPLFLSLILVKNFPDRSIFEVSGLDKHELISRTEYYQREIVRIHANKIGRIYLDKYRFLIERVEKKVAQPLNIQVYFSTTRDSVYGIFLLPFFLFGAIYLIRVNGVKTLIFLILSLIASIPIKTDFSMYFLLALINTCILIALFEGSKYISKHLW